jgi:hypothetical protein
MLQGLVRVTRDLASLERNDPPAGTAGERFGAGAKGKVMWRLVKLLVILAVLAALGLILYAYLGPLFFPADFAAPVEQVTEPVTLELD